MFNRKDTISKWLLLLADFSTAHCLGSNLPLLISSYQFSAVRMKQVPLLLCGMPSERTVRSVQDFNMSVTVVLAQANKDFSSRLSKENVRCIRETFRCLKVFDAAHRATQAVLSRQTLHKTQPEAFWVWVTLTLEDRKRMCVSHLPLSL